MLVWQSGLQSVVIVVEGGLITTAWPQPSPATILASTLASPQTISELSHSSPTLPLSWSQLVLRALTLTSPSRNDISRGAPVQSRSWQCPRPSLVVRQSCELRPCVQPAVRAELTLRDATTENKTAERGQVGAGPAAGWHRPQDWNSNLN